MLLADAIIKSIDSEFWRWLITVMFEIVSCVVAVFLILLILVQRGRGGGLAGALGGMGGQSAFGTRAGDTFTWITYITAAIWILLATVTIKTFTDPHADKEAAIANRKERTNPDEGELKGRDKAGETTKDSSKTDPVDGKIDTSKTEPGKTDTEPKIKDETKTDDKTPPVKPEGEGKTEDAPKPEKTPDPENKPEPENTPKPEEKKPEGEVEGSEKP